MNPSASIMHHTGIRVRECISGSKPILPAAIFVELDFALLPVERQN